MTAPLIAQIERERNLADVRALCRHYEGEIAYYESEIARARKLLEAAQRVAATLEEKLKAVTNE